MTAIRLLRRLALGAACAICLGLAGCLLPDEFEARLTVKPDSSYELDLEGKLFAVEFFRDLSDGRVSSDDPFLKDIALELRRYEGVYYSRYL